MIDGLAFLMVSQVLLELSLTLILINFDSIRLFDFGCWRWYSSYAAFRWCVLFIISFTQSLTPII